jgi:hypothetical protein
MAKRKRYDDKFRASAVVMLEAAGYTGDEHSRLGSLTEVSREIGVPMPTLSNWFKGVNNPPPSEIVTEKKADLAVVFEDIAYKMLAHAGNPDVIDSMSGKDAVIAAATATDKMRLLRGLPTEIVQIIPDLVAAIESMGQSPADVFNRIIQRARENARS